VALEYDPSEKHALLIDIETRKANHMWFPYFKGQPTDYVIRYSGGQCRGEGPGLAFYYWRFNTQIVAVPTQSQEASFVFNELTSDFQEVTLQGQVTFRIKDPKTAATLFNFGIDPESHSYLGDDHEKIGRRIANLTQIATRSEVTRRKLEEVLRDASVLASAVAETLRSGSVLSDMGVEVLTADFLSVRPTPEVGKALEAELRESFLRKADEAIYARRAAAVDEERNIKEKELASDKALEEQRKGLIELQGLNALHEAQNQAEARAVSAKAEAEAARLLLAVYRDLEPRALLAHAMRELGANAGQIGNLTITTELLSSLLKEPTP
jgi:regulator of protease activity HflC (stomatin/prohibitin superfamily)